MNVLEQRYRSVLRMLPASYRERWEEDMVATFLASMETDDADDAEYLADYGRPSWSEVTSVARLAVRLRVGGAGLPPVSAAWAEAVRAVRLVALAVLLVSAVMVTMEAAVAVWLASGLPWFPMPDGLPAPVPTGWQLVAALTGLVWVAPYLALVFGRWHAARWLAGLAILHAVTIATDLAVTRWTDPLVPLLVGWTNLLISVLLMLSLAAFHQDTPPVRRRPWLVALGVGIALSPAHQFALWAFWTLPSGTWVLLDWPGLCCVLVVAAGAAYLIAHMSGRGRTPSEALALALLALAALVQRAISLADYTTLNPAFNSTTGYAPLLVGMGQAVVVLIVGILLAALAARGLRRIPPADSRAVPTPSR